MRTVEKRWEISNAILPCVSSAKRSKTSSSLLCIECRSGLVEDEQIAHRAGKLGRGQFSATRHRKVPRHLRSGGQGSGRSRRRAWRRPCPPDSCARRQFDVGLVMRLSTRPTAMFSRAVISKRMKSWKMTPICLCRASREYSRRSMPSSRIWPSVGS